MQQAFSEHLLGAQPRDQHLEEDMNEPHPDLQEPTVQQGETVM